MNEKLRNRTVDAGSIIAASLVALGGLTIGIGNTVGGVSAAVELAATGSDSQTEAAVRAVNDSVFHVPVLQAENPLSGLPLAPIAGTFGLLGVYALHNRFRSSP